MSGNFSTIEKNAIKIHHNNAGISFDTGSINLTIGVPNVKILVQSGEKTINIADSKCRMDAILVKSTYCGRVEETSYTYFDLCSSDDNGLICKGNAAEWVLSTLIYGPVVGNLEEILPSKNDSIRRKWQGFGSPIPFKLSEDEKSNDGRWRSYQDYITLYKDDGRTGIVVGAAGEPEADVRFDCRVDNGKLKLAIISQMNDIIVDPGQWRCSQEVALIAGDYLTLWTRASGIQLRSTI